MTLLGIDEDWSKADPAGLWAAGYRFAIGYVSQDTTGKNITRPQIDALHGAGLDVGLVYEYAPQSALGGAAAGTADAQVAISHAQQLGTPAGVALYTAVDFNVTAAQLAAVLAYATAFQEGCAKAGYRSGVYAEYEVCAYLAQHGYTGFLWQTYAWSGTPPQWWAGDALRQTLNGITVAGATVDRDEAEVADWGQWRGTDMALADEHLISAPKVTALQALDDLWSMEYLGHSGIGGPTDVHRLNRQIDDIQEKVGGLASAPAPTVTLSDTQLQAVVDGVSAQLGGKLDDVAAALTRVSQQLAAAGHALES